MIFNYYKNRFYINMMVIFLFFVAVIIFVIYPAFVEINQVNAEIIAERTKLQYKLAMGLNIKKIARNLDSIKEPAKLLDTVFVSKGGELKFVNQLERMAAKNDVGVQLNSDFINQDAKPGLNQVEIQIVINGNYKQIIRFIDELEKTKAYVNFKTLIFSPDQKNADTVNAQLIGNIYFK